MKLHIFARKITALFLAICIVFLFASCSGKGISVSDKIKTVSAEKPESSLHTQDKSALTSVTKSGLYELFFDEKNCSAPVRIGMHCRKQKTPKAQ